MATDQEPIFWVNARDAKPGAREREIPRMVKGRRIMERVPQRVRASDAPDAPFLRYERWIHVLKQDGHIHRVPVTNAAAHTDAFTSFAAYQKAKAVYFGWLPVGQCPCRLLKGGLVKPDVFACADLLTAEPCGERAQDAHGIPYGDENPCPHLLRERDARAAAAKADWEDRASSYKSEADRVIEAGASQMHQTIAEVGKSVAKEVAEAIGHMRAESPKPNGGKRGGEAG